MHACMHTYLPNLPTYRHTYMIIRVCVFVCLCVCVCVTSLYVSASVSLSPSLGKQISKQASDDVVQQSMLVRCFQRWALSRGMHKPSLIVARH